MLKLLVPILAVGFVIPYDHRATVNAENTVTLRRSCAGEYAGNGVWVSPESLASVCQGQNDEHRTLFEQLVTSFQTVLQEAIYDSRSQLAGLKRQLAEERNMTADIEHRLQEVENKATELERRLDNHRSISVRIVSAGYNDPGFLYGRGEIWVDGVQYAVNRRGYNIVIVNERTGQKEHSVGFDPYGDPDAGTAMRDYLRAIPVGRIVLIAVKDTANTYSGDVMADLTALGAVSPDIGFRTSWAMISKKGSKTSWFVEDERDRYAGPTVIEAEVPLSI
ncbi:POMGNT1 [Branchiostoma lanceolatum]|uniref:POMGNT1 protein n=1 Tax=Branchiostoma lanceolatum TaxID=7740 RepID=A0A8J9ZKW0_BRALA|nr:POMGNT1 [Branchiostoma lanceolatum]